MLVRTYVVRCQNCLWVYFVGTEFTLPDGFMDKYWPQSRCISCGKLTKHMAEVACVDGLPMVIWNERKKQTGFIVPSVPQDGLEVREDVG